MNIHIAPCRECGKQPEIIEDKKSTIIHCCACYVKEKISFFATQKWNKINNEEVSK